MKNQISCPEPPPELIMHSTVIAVCSKSQKSTANSSGNSPKQKLNQQVKPAKHAKIPVIGQSGMSGRNFLRFNKVPVDLKGRLDRVKLNFRAEHRPDGAGTKRGDRGNINTFKKQRLS